MVLRRRGSNDDLQGYIFLDCKLVFAMEKKSNANFNLKMTLGFRVMIKCKGSHLTFWKATRTCSFLADGLQRWPSGGPASSCVGGLLRVTCLWRAVLHARVRTWVVLPAGCSAHSVHPLGAALGVASRSSDLSLLSVLLSCPRLCRSPHTWKAREDHQGNELWPPETRLNSSPYAYKLHCLSVSSPVKWSH